MSELRNAATTVLIRDGNDDLEVLLLKRSSYGVFGNMWVFPGGALEAGDLAHDSDMIGTAGIAACRETREEAGLEIDADALLFFAHWIPPENLPSRYATWFFIAEVEPDSPIEVDNHEIVEHIWISPKQALQSHDAGSLPMAPPTFVTLTELSHRTSCSQAIELYRHRGAIHYAPRFIHLHGQNYVSLYPDDAGYNTSDPDVAGKRDRLYVKDGRCRYENSSLIMLSPP